MTRDRRREGDESRKNPGSCARGEAPPVLLAGSSSTSFARRKRRARASARFKRLRSVFERSERAMRRTARAAGGQIIPHTRVSRVSTRAGVDRVTDDARGVFRVSGGAKRCEFEGVSLYSIRRSVSFGGAKRDARARLIVRGDRHPTDGFFPNRRAMASERRLRRRSWIEIRERY